MLNACMRESRKSFKRPVVHRTQAPQSQTMACLIMRDPGCPTTHKRLKLREEQTLRYRRGIPRADGDKETWQAGNESGIKEASGMLEAYDDDPHFRVSLSLINLTHKLQDRRNRAQGWSLTSWTQRSPSLTLVAGLMKPSQEEASGSRGHQVSGGLEELGTTAISAARWCRPRWPELTGPPPTSRDYSLSRAQGDEEWNKVCSSFLRTHEQGLAAAISILIPITACLPKPCSPCSLSLRTFWWTSPPSKHPLFRSVSQVLARRGLAGL